MLQALPGQKLQRNEYEERKRSENENVQRKGIRACEQRYLEVPWPHNSPIQS